MKKIITTLLSIQFCVITMAQPPKADRLFDKWEYFRAAALYEKEAVSNPSPDVYYKLGECYQKMNSYTDAQKWYDKVNEAGPYSNPQFYLNYGLILKNNSRYEQAKVAFQKYADLMPSDSRGIFYKNSCDAAMVYHDNNSSVLPLVLTNISTLNSENADFSPALYKDGIIFASTRPSDNHSKIYGWTGGYYLDLYHAKTGNSPTEFKDVSAFEGKDFNKKFHDGPACFSKDYNTIYFSRVERSLKGEAKKTLRIETIKIFSSTIQEDEWSDPEPFSFNNDSFSVATPFLSTDGNRLYFASDMPGGLGETDIYFCNKEGDRWSKPINMGESINTFGKEKFPYMNSAGNFYFSSDGYVGLGGLDICEAKYQNGAFARASPLPVPFNSSTDDFGIIFLDNSGTGYFSSNRAGGKGDEDIYYFDLSHDDIIAQVLPVPVDTVKMPIVAKAAVPNGIIIHFDFDKYKIRPDAKSALDSVVAYMKRDSAVVLQLDAYTDIRGKEKYNDNLSNQRGDATLKYLVSKGINIKRIKVTGHGYSHLLNHCSEGVACTDDEHQVNRRVEFLFKPDAGYSTSGL